MNLLQLILPSLIPVFTDGLKGLFQSLFGGTKPISVDDQIKLMNAEIEKLKALAELDRPSAEISRWVADLRASFRYLAAGIIIISTIICLPITSISDEAKNTMLNLSSSIFSFMFGDRVYLWLKSKPK